MQQTLADLVLLAHVAVVLFVVGGLVMVVIGGALGWGWVRHRGFRRLHLATIAVVVLLTWLGITCPLTTVESGLRMQAGADGYAAGFIEHWVHRVLFYEAPAWVFTSLYTAFAALVVATWWFVPPGRRRSSGVSR